MKVKEIIITITILSVFSLNLACQIKNDYKWKSIPILSNNQDIVRYIEKNGFMRTVENGGEQYKKNWDFGIEYLTIATEISGNSSVAIMLKINESWAVSDVIKLLISREGMQYYEKKEKVVNNNEFTYHNWISDKTIISSVPIVTPNGKMKIIQGLITVKR